MGPIAILGDGVTGKAVKEKCLELGIAIVDAIEELDKASLVVASPGIPPEQYPSVDVEIISEIEFAYRLMQVRLETPQIIGVTGTNGKSTVTALIAHILDCPMSGNIGTPLISFIGNMPERIVVELSSYQLERCYDFKADISVILNLTPDHLQRHDTMDAYMDAKARLYRHAKESDWIIYDGSSRYIRDSICDAVAQQKNIVDCATDLELKNDSLPGLHNRFNMAAAFLAAKATGMLVADILEKIRSFKGLEHRLESVMKISERHFINDSKATNPDATIKAVESYHKPTHLILCGADKDLDVGEFLYDIAQEVASIILCGGISQRYFDTLKRLNVGCAIEKVETVKEAVRQSYTLSQPGDIILFSPSSASFDQFTNYEERGQVFKDEVKKLSA